MSVCGKNFNVMIFLDTVNYDKCQTLHDVSAYRALPIYTTFSDRDCTCRSQQCQTVLTEKLMFLFS